MISLTPQAGEAAWVIGHVTPSWDGSNALPNPSDVFTQIINRFSPHVVRAVFFGHTHEDQISIYYRDNSTVVSANTANMVQWTGPSITPLTGLNSGFRAYEVDADTFEIRNSYTWVNDVSAAGALDSQVVVGPSYYYEYSAREAYGANVTWPNNAPLNATCARHTADATADVAGSRLSF